MITKTSPVMKKISDTFYTVSVLDVEQILPFVKKEAHGFKEKFKEEERVKMEMFTFIEMVSQEMGEKICYIGEEKKHGYHLEMFLFHDGGFLEILVEPPSTIHASFVYEKKAEKFAKSLKRVCEKILPDSPIKLFFLDSITVDEGKNDSITVDKWSLMHNIVIEKSIVYTIVVVLLAIIFTAVTEILEDISVNWVGIEATYIHIVTAIFIAFLFDPIKTKVEGVLEKIINKHTTG
ncbi:hypothetical protein HYS47_00430 [Candidatus Woesearchaeota archaeon]|nr:hypothetical protein [Candidatus Woesearchaeota archaeon]